MDDAGRVDVLEASEDLVEEVLDELLLERAAGEESVEIGAEELSDKVAVRRKAEREGLIRFVSILAQKQQLSQASGVCGTEQISVETYMSSRGEMKMSLRLMICGANE